MSIEIELLTQFNLTSNEALIYYTLLTNGSLNGYQIAKITGVSRSNTYASLSSLVDKGCAYVVDGESKIYSPLDISEFCSNRIRNLETAKNKLIELVPSGTANEPEYITIKGAEHIKDKISNIIEGTKQRIYLSMPKKVLDLYEPMIVSLASDKIKVVIITDCAADIEKASVYISAEPLYQVRIIADSSKVLTGDFEGPTCLYSEKKNLVELIKDSIRNEMTLIQLKNSKPQKPAEK